MFFLILVKIGCFLSRGFGLGAPAVYGLPCLVVWAAAVCRALLRCTGFPVWSFGLLRLAGRSRGARASLSGRLGCCGLPGALAVHGLRLAAPIKSQVYACNHQQDFPIR